MKNEDSVQDISTKFQWAANLVFLQKIYNALSSDLAFIKKGYICPSIWQMSDENTSIDVNKIVKHWIDTSEDDFQAMQSLFDSKSYGWSLFLGHISIEKLLKAYYMSVKIKNTLHLHTIYTD